MNCLKCGFQNPDGAKYCQKCANVFVSSNQSNSSNESKIEVMPQQEEQEKKYQGLTPSHEQVGQHKKKKSRKIIRWLIVIGVFIVFIVLANIIFPIIFGSISLSKMGPKSRDTRRVSDIKQVQTSLELYYDNIKRYPEKVIFGGELNYEGVTYMYSVPENPIPNDGKCPDNFEYEYEVKNNGQSYELTYCLGTDYKEEEGYHTVSSPSHMNNNSIQPDNAKFNFEDIDSNQYSEQRLIECFVDLGILSPGEELRLSEQEKQENWQYCLDLQKGKASQDINDTDGDTLKDDDETNIYGTDPKNPDTDSDWLGDGDEVILGTDPNNPDTDGDGYLDGNEFHNGYDPLRPGDVRL